VDSKNSVYDSRANCNAIIETKTNELILGCKITVIPNSVTSIGDYAFFSCDGLTSITIPNSVTSIGDHAFQGCDGLASITIPSSVTSIGDYAFYYCDGLTSITIGNSVTSIGDYAFYSCNGLTSITIPNSVTSIGPSVFSYCTNLKTINCRASSKPSGWDNNWNGSDATVVWGYTEAASFAPVSKGLSLNKLSDMFLTNDLILIKRRFI